MLSPDTIDAMSPAQTRETANEIATEYFGTDRWRPQFIAMAGVSRIQQWFTDENRVPTWALVLLSAALDAKRAEAHLNSIRSAIHYSANLSEK